MVKSEIKFAKFNNQDEPEAVAMAISFWKQFNTSQHMNLYLMLKKK